MVSTHRGKPATARSTSGSARERPGQCRGPPQAHAGLAEPAERNHITLQHNVGLSVLLKPMICTVQGQLPSVRLLWRCLRWHLLSGAGAGPGHWPVCSDGTQTSARALRSCPGHSTPHTQKLGSCKHLQHSSPVCSPDCTLANPTPALLPVSCTPNLYSPLSLCPP